MRIKIFYSIIILSFSIKSHSQISNIKITHSNLEIYFGINASNSQIWYFEDQNSNFNPFKPNTPRYFFKPHLGISQRFKYGEDFKIGIGLRYQNKGGRYSIPGLTGSSNYSYDNNHCLIILFDNEYEIINHINIYNAFSFGLISSENFGIFGKSTWSILSGLNFKIAKRSKIGVYYNQDINSIKFSRAIRFYSIDLSYYYNIINKS